MHAKCAEGKCTGNTSKVATKTNKTQKTLVCFDNCRDSMYDCMSFDLDSTRTQSGLTPTYGQMLGLGKSSFPVGRPTIKAPY